MHTYIHPAPRFQELKLKDSWRFPGLQANTLSGTCVSVWVKTETNCTSQCSVPMCSLAVYCDQYACVPFAPSQSLDEAPRSGWGGVCRTGGNRQFSGFECDSNICAPRRPALFVAQSWDFNMLCWNFFFFFFILAENIGFLGLTFFLWVLSWGRF